MEVPLRENPEAWEGILGGLAELFAGVARAVAAGTLQPAAVSAALPVGSLLQLYASCASAGARAAVLAIAAAVAQLPAAQELRVG